MVYVRNLFKLPQLTACFGVLWVLVFQSVVVDPLDIGDTHVAPDFVCLCYVILITELCVVLYYCTICILITNHESAMHSAFQD